MNKIIDKARRLLFSTSYSTYLFAVIVAAVAALFAYYSKEIIFYEYDTTAAAYRIEMITADEPLPQTAPIDLHYDGETMVYTANPTAEGESVSVYAASRFGVAKLTEDNMNQLDETFLGNFAASYPKQKFDIDGDDQDEQVFYYIKTDLRSIQSNSAATPMLRDKNIVMEIGLNKARELFVYFQTKPLGERNVIVHFADGTSKEFVTDANGYVNGLTLHQIRAGVTIEYAPNGLNTYICKYVPETASIVSSAIIPLIWVASLSLFAIILCLHLRKRAERKSGHRDYTRGGCVGGVHYKPAFVVIRWIIMIASFLLLTWGGAWLGFWFEELYIPVLSCSKYNQEQIVASACYYMSHLNILFTLPWQTIVTFFACFFIPIILFGRLFCGFICPMGLVQDVLHITRQKTGIQGVTLNERLYERLSIIKWTCVILFLGMGFAGLDFCNICPAVTLSPAFSGFKTSVYISGFLMLFVLAGSFFKSRFFCTICPMGLIMGLFYRISLVRLKKDCTACTECGACYSACPMGIKSVYTEREQADVTTINCLMCGECIRNCPENKALKMTLAGIPLYTSSREKFMKRYGRRNRKEGA